ncbi:MAG: chloride channel protein [Acidiferrobacterales bacterium]|jgi:H+/Cl- antiporter ClcA|nr:chloride channel protein [Acidiferrobacterales bacterium]
MFHRLRQSDHEFLSAKRWKTRLVFWVGAVAIGTAAAGFAVGARYAEKLFHLGTDRYYWLPLILTPAGLVAVAWFTRKFIPGAEGSGIPQAIAALTSRHEPHRKVLLSMRIAIGKIFTTLIGLACGASIGREGPTVHVGAAIMYSIGRLAHFPRHDLERGLILAGGAAGVAAAFNTPLAGILFAIEEMSRSFDEKSSGTMFLAVVLAGVVAVAWLGEYTYFGHTEAALLAATDWIAVAVCGVAGGLLGGIFSLVLISGNRRLRPYVSRFPLRVAAICGITVAVAGVLSGGAVFGTGYEEASKLVTGVDEGSVYYPFLKMLATAASYFSGIPGGIFAPSLSTGAGLGHLLSLGMPDVPTTAVVILGMVAYFSGVVQTPITAFVIVMEMTDNRSILLPLMATSFIAYGVSRIISPQPIYRTLAEAFVWQPPEEETEQKPDAEDSLSEGKGNENEVK